MASNGLAEALACIVTAVALVVAFTVVPARVGSSAPVTAVAAITVGAAFFNPRVDLSLATLAIYLGCLDGPLKLTTGNSKATLVRDVLILAVLVGVLVRATISRQRFPSIPYAGLTLALVGIVLVQTMHPNTAGSAGALAGIRQHLEFVPLLFLATLVADDRRVLPMLGALLVVITLANTVAAIVQYNLTPQQFASWGPGYADKILGRKGFVGAARVFGDANSVKVRPFGLGGDSGASGIYGWVSAPFALVLLIGATTRRAIVVGVAAFLICGVGILASQSRGAALTAFIAVLAFFALRTKSRNAVSTLVAAGVAGVLVYVFFTAFAASSGSQATDRIRTLGPGEAATTLQEDRGASLALTPGYAASYPFGVGLARAGPGSGTAGNPNGLDAENEPNFLIEELGTFGFALFLAFWLVVVRDACVLARVSHEDEAQRAFWCAVAAVLVGGTAVWLQSTPTTGPPVGALFWFFAGLIGCETRARKEISRHGRERSTGVPATPGIVV